MRGVAAASCFLVALAGCATAIPGSASLAAQVGHTVELHGTFLGLGKAGYYVEVDDESILLDVDAVDLARIGDKATVRGTLGYTTLDPPPSTEERVPVREGYFLTGSSLEFDR